MKELSGIQLLVGSGEQCGTTPPCLRKQAELPPVTVEMKRLLRGGGLDIVPDLLYQTNNVATK